MKKHATYRKSLLSAGALLFMAGTFALPSFADDKQNVYATPEKAVDALIYASRHDHVTQLVKILGPASEKLVNSGDDVADQEGRKHFVAAYDKAHKLEKQNDTTDVLAVGDEEWPVPIPLVRDARGWHWDTVAGQDEILNRRIGRNELNVIEVCRAYVEAQRDYALLTPAIDGKHEYAQRFLSSEGAHDGLYWAVKDGEPESPLGPLLAKAAGEGYSDKAAIDQREPYHGYYYKILKSQTDNATGGAADYVKDGHMTGGFALLAFPANYGDTGVMSFIVNQNGIVHEKNLGPNTAEIAAGITQYDPDDSWTIQQ